MKYTAASPLVLNSSALQAYRRCPKSFELSYLRGFQCETNRAVEEGISFHEMVAQAARGVAEEKIIADNLGSPMLPVFISYMKYVGLKGETVAVEQPLYTKVLSGVWIRTTFDRIYMSENDGLVVKDYKTFSNAPNLDVELNFQSKLYSIVVQKHYSLELPPRFEFDYVRRTPPYVEKDKKGGVWTPDECYKTWPIYVSTREAAVLWGELVETCREILGKVRLYEPGNFKFARTALTTSGWSAFSCDGCFVKELCKTEAATGTLGQATINAAVTEIKQFPPPLPAGCKRKVSYLATREESEKLR